MVESALSGRQKLLRIFGSLCAIALGGIFLYAGILKAADPQLFATQISSYKILPESWGLGAAYFTIAVELLLGLAVVLLILPRIGVTFIMLTLLVFIVATGWAWAHGNAESCGCFGRAAARGPLAVILEDIGFLVLGVIALRFAHGWPPAKLRWGLFLIASPILLGAPVWMAKLPVDPYVTPIYAGADLKNVAVDGLRLPINEGSVLLAFYGPDCDACDLSVAVLDEIAGTEGAPNVAAVYAGTNRAKRAFQLEHVPSFPIGHSPEAVLRQYYRQLPVFALLEDGIVQKAWWGTPPEKDEVVAP